MAQESICSNVASLSPRASISGHFDRVLGHTGHHPRGSWLHLDDGGHDSSLDFNVLRCVTQMIR